MFLLHIVQPTRITSHSNTLIDNIFSNYISEDIVSANLRATISDHLPQFLIAPHIFPNVPNRKTNIFERDWSKFNHEEFILDYFSVDWPHALKLQNNDIDASSQNFFDSINNILDKHAPFKKDYPNYLTKENTNSFFLSPTDKEEIKLILSSLDISKATGPYSIPTKVLKLLKNDISDQVADLFFLSFITGSFPTLLKTAKVIPIIKKESKLDYTSYRPISLLSNPDKILEIIMHNRLYKFLMIITLFIHSSLAFDKNTLPTLH